MESFLPSEIARLVLGYLEHHKCEEAYEAFLKTSAHLVECVNMKEEGRKFRTEVMGLNLLDILYEYSAIYSLVQEKLKKVDPDTASSLKHSGSLLDKITFLLNATSSGQTMLFSITLPPGKSPSTAHVRKRLRSTTMHEKKKELRKHTQMNIEDFSPIVELDEPVTNPSTLETTSLSSLPGNANIILDRSLNLEANDNIVRTPKRKQYSTNSTRRSRNNSEIPEDTEENLDITALTKALLDNHELHEKIAENINKVIRTPDLASGVNISQNQDLCSAQGLTLSETFPNNFTLELDDAIKKIVEQTESDPLFENFLQEVVCPSTETSDDGEEKGISDTSTPYQSTPETIKKTLVKRLRSTKKRDSPTTSSSDSPAKIEHQNAVAIESIVAIQADPVENEPKKQDLVPAGSQISFSGSSENADTQKNLSQKVSQPVVYSESVEYPPMSDSTLVILSSKFTNTGSQILTVQPASYKNSSFADDILRMPTVIIKDDQNPSNNLFVPTRLFPLGNGPPPLQKIKNPPLLLPHPTINTNVTTIPAETITHTVNVQPVPSTSAEPSTSNQLPENRSVPLISTSSGKKNKNEQPKPATPERSNSKERLSLSTPRGGRSSHIRALDFSTPPKENIQKKSLTSSKTRIVSKPRSPKKSRFNLFTSPLNMPIATRSPHEKLQGDWTGTELLFEPEKSKDTENKNEETKKKKLSSWDQDLRELVPPVLPAPKKKRCRKKISPKVVDNTEEQPEEKLSKTEEDGKAIETELKDKPVKVIKKRIRKKPDESKPKPVRRKRQAKLKPVVQSEVKEELIEIKTEELIIKEETAEENIQQSKETIEDKQHKETVEQTQETTEVVEDKQIKEFIQNKEEEDRSKITEEEKVTKAKEPPKSRLKRKCNLGSSIKKTSSNLEDKDKSPVDSTSEEANSLTVLSPSKMKAKKRIYDVQDSDKPLNEPSTSNKPEIDLSPSKLKAKKQIFAEELKPDEDKKISVEPSTSSKAESTITPDMAKLFESNSIKAKKNVTPMLETPFKDATSLLPITPRILTSFTVDASFSSLIKQNCGDVDLSSILTPSFPMTPSFPLTPNVPTCDSQSSYASRPTDYSNSSSYYQPSDSEQNQKLEQALIEEAMKLESAALKRQIWTSTPDKENNKELSVPPTDTMPNSVGEMKISTEPQKLNSSLDVTKASIKSFVNDYDLSTSSSDQSEENLQVEKESNDTVIHITPGQLKRGGKHMSMLKNLMQPVELNSESDDVSEEECSEKEHKNIPTENMNIKTVDKSQIKEVNLEPPKKDENIKVVIRKNKSVKEDKKPPTENMVIKTEEKSQIKEVNLEPPKKDENIKPVKGKKKSIATKIHSTLLEELEMKRKRIIAELQSDSTKSTEPKPRGRPKGIARVIPKVIPKRTPKVIPKEKAKASPKEKAKVSPKEKTKISPKEKPKMSPKEEKKCSPVKKPKGSPKEKPKGTPKEKLKGTLQGKLKRVQDKLKGTPQGKLMRTPQGKLKGTPQGKLKETSRRKLKASPKSSKIKKLADPTRVTRARVIANKKEESEVIEKLEEKPVKYITPKKIASIEDVAARLKKDQNNSENVQNSPIEKIENTVKCPLISPNTSMDSHDSIYKGKDIPMMSAEDEDVPRLHLSSDDETADECDIVKGLKERGIHLIPKKPLDKKSKDTVKDDDNPVVINTQKLDLTVAEEDVKNQNISIDVEESIPQTRIEKSIEIKSDIYLHTPNKIDVSKVLTENIAMESIIRNHKKKTRKNEVDNSQDEKKNSEKSKGEESTEKNEIQNSENKQSVSTETNIDFDLKVITEDSSEYIKVVHDESKIITKTISDYNLEVLNKKITAKVFSEELNIEQDKTMTVTPFIEVISYPAKSPKVIIKPLEILYNEIDDESTVDTLFEESPNIKIKKIIKKQTDLQTSIQKEKQKVDTVSRTVSESKPKKKISLAQYKNKQTQKTEEIEELVKTKNKSLELNSDEEDLMNFAITGNEKDKTDTPVQDSISRKRKAEFDVLKSPNEKRPKTKNALLKTLNVDQFLSMLHGPSCSKV